MGNSDYLKTLGNRQLTEYYKVTYHKLNTIKQEIIENITNILGRNPYSDNEGYADPKEFIRQCKPYETSIKEENKDLFTILMRKEQDIQEEIKKRQIKMLRSIRIIASSIRVRTIIENTRWEDFAAFDDMIRYIKLKHEWKVHTRPQKKVIQIPQKLVDLSDFIWQPITIILENNSWPLEN